MDSVKYLARKVIDKNLKQQLKLADEIMNTTGINIVTCGNCGNVSVHKLYYENRMDVNEYSCPYCGYTSDISDFPDLFY